MYLEDQITALRERVGAVLSDKRFAHTLGVERAAVRIGRLCMPDSIAELRCAALLHDIAKEIGREEQDILISYVGELTESDVRTPAAYHAFVAPALIRRDYPTFATDNILSAVFKHTTADREMSVFDQVIYLADYIEEGRTYPDCVKVRESFFSECKASLPLDLRLAALRRAVVNEIMRTIVALDNRGSEINQRTYDALANLDDNTRQNI